MVDASLARLRVDQLDLFYQHRVDPNVPNVVGGRSFLWNVSVNDAFRLR